MTEGRRFCYWRASSSQSSADGPGQKAGVGDQGDKVEDFRSTETGEKAGRLSVSWWPENINSSIDRYLLLKEDPVPFLVPILSALFTSFLVLSTPCPIQCSLHMFAQIQQDIHFGGHELFYSVMPALHGHGVGPSHAPHSSWPTLTKSDSLTAQFTKPAWNSLLSALETRALKWEKENLRGRTK